MHPRVKEFVEDLHRDPPPDLAKAFAEGWPRSQHLKEFDLDDLSDERHARRVGDAETALPHLVDFAKQGRTMTFTEFVGVVGRGSPRGVNGGTLNPLAALCITQGLPPLWTLVVAASTGLGSGYWRERDDAEKVARQEACFEFYGATRRPEGLVGEVCPRCFIERTTTGACLC